MQLTKELLANYNITEDGKVIRLSGSGRTGEINGMITRGYRVVGLTIDGKRVFTGVHRLVALVFIPNPENKPYINHKDGNKLNNHVSNLEWCTASENQIHAFNMGLQTISSCNKNGLSQGSLLPQSKLDEDTVYRIRIKKLQGVTYSELSKEYGISIGNLEKMVSPTRKTRTWKHVKYPTKEDLI